MLAVLVLAAAGCGNKTKEVTTTNSQGATVTRTVPSVHFAKAKFLLHGALAYGAFHRYIYKPLKAGTFRSGAPGRGRALAKAAAAGLFTLRELQQMRRAALSDDRLRPIADRIGGLFASLGSLAGRLRNGSIDRNTIDGVQGGLDGVVGAARSAGAKIPLDKAPSVGG